MGLRQMRRGMGRCGHAHERERRAGKACGHVVAGIKQREEALRIRWRAMRQDLLSRDFGESGKLVLTAQSSLMSPDLAQCRRSRIRPIANADVQVAPIMRYDFTDGRVALECTTDAECGPQSELQPD